MDAGTDRPIGLLGGGTKLADEYRALGPEALGTDDLQQIFHAMRTDPLLHFEHGDEMVEQSKIALARAEAAMGDWFEVVPQAPCAVSGTEVGAKAFYFPPAGDGSRGGTFFVNVAENPTLDFKAPTAEGYGYTQFCVLYTAWLRTQRLSMRQVAEGVLGAVGERSCVVPEGVVAVPVPGALPRIIRVLMHYHAPDNHVARHVYLGEARTLRQDLEGAQ